MKGNFARNFKRVYTSLIYFLLYAPIFVLILYSFNDSKLNAVWAGFTFKWYKSLFSNYGILEATRNTLIIAIVSTILSVILGTITAVGMYKYKFKGKTVLDSTLFVPIVIPEIVVGIAMLSFFSQINMDRGILTLIIAHITFSVSYVFIVVRSRLDGFDKSLEEAAMDLGATPLQTFFKVTLPVIMPGIVAGGLLAFTLSLDDVIISFFVSGADSPTLPIKVLSMVKFGVTPEINALSTIMLLFTLAIVVVMQLLNSNKVNTKKVLKFASGLLVFILVVGIGAFGITSSNKKNEQTLNLFNWSEYLPQSVIDKFEQTYGIKVNYSTYSSNEEMLAKIMAGGSSYDLAVASDYMVEVLQKSNLLEPIEKDTLSNVKNLDEATLGLPFDPENKYSLPYMWLGVTIGYDQTKVSKPITGYADLWDPEFKNSLVVLDDQRIIIGMALKKLGYSINTTDPKALAEAKAELEKLTPNIKAFDSDSPKTLLINGEAKAGLAWGAEISLAKRDNENIVPVLAKEGLILQQDNFVIPKDAPNKEAAKLFMDFIMQPEISAEISAEFPYANPNKAAFPLIDEDILNDIAVFPPAKEKATGEYLKDIGSSMVDFDNIWSDIKK
jgi:spermidine/putrescine transport system permease protein